jgi:probable HAF family extracellular repeat protein
MSRVLASILICLSIVPLSLVAQHSHPPSVTYSFVSITFPGSATTNPYDINHGGVIVGVFTSSQLQRGFEEKNGVYKRISFPGSSDTFALGINNFGRIVGGYDGAPCPTAGQTCGFLKSGST